MQKFVGVFVTYSGLNSNCVSLQFFLPLFQKVDCLCVSNLRTTGIWRKNVPPFSVACLIKYSHFTIWCIVKKSCKIATIRMNNSVDDIMSPLQILVSTSHKTYLVINIFSRVKFVVKKELGVTRDSQSSRKKWVPISPHTNWWRRL